MKNVREELVYSIIKIRGDMDDKVIKECTVSPWRKVWLELVNKTYP